MTTAVIIDDIEKARALLKQDLEQYCPDLTLVGEAEGVVSGMKLIKQQKPDIVFLDINMNDGTGFDLLELLDSHSFSVIFTTASNEHAIRAFKFSAIDYLLKPIDIDELITAVSKAKKSHGNNIGSSKHVELLMNNVKSNQPLEKIALHTMEKIHICEIKDIVRCESNVNYTTFYFHHQKPILVTKTLKHFDEILRDSGFYRAHQSHLINLSHVKEYVKMDGGYVVMNDGSNAPISSRKKNELISLIT